MLWRNVRLAKAPRSKPSGEESGFRLAQLRGGIVLCVGCHRVYTVSTPTPCWAAGFSRYRAGMYEAPGREVLHVWCACGRAVTLGYRPEWNRMPKARLLQALKCLKCGQSAVELRRAWDVEVQTTYPV